MKHHCKKPCRECPWRKQHPAGWLGGYSPELYADWVQNGVVPACHLTDKGPEDDRTSFCAGALTVMKNQCILPIDENQPGARAAIAETEKSDDCFPNVFAFYEHHSGEPYVLPILRSQQ